MNFYFILELYDMDRTGTININEFQELFQRDTYELRKSNNRQYFQTFGNWDYALLYLYLYRGTLFHGVKSL